MECEPDAHAALNVKLIPLSLKIVERFILTVLFMFWKIAPLPYQRRIVFFFHLVHCFHHRCRRAVVPIDNAGFRFFRKSMSNPDSSSASRVAI